MNISQIAMSALIISRNARNAVLVTFCLHVGFALILADPAIPKESICVSDCSLFSTHVANFAQQSCVKPP